MMPKGRILTVNGNEDALLWTDLVQKGQLQQSAHEQQEL